MDCEHEAANGNVEHVMGPEVQRISLAKDVFFNRLGEIHDRRFESQRYRTSGLNLVTAAIALWNTIYLERAIEAINNRGEVIDKGLLKHLSPLGWEHINLTGDYLWQTNRKVDKAKLRPLLQSKSVLLQIEVLELLVIIY